MESVACQYQPAKLKPARDGAAGALIGLPDNPLIGLTLDPPFESKEIVEATGTAEELSGKDVEDDSASESNKSSDEDDETEVEDSEEEESKEEDTKDEDKSS